MTKQQEDLLRRIGSLIRGDWSGDMFDGRDVDNWIWRVINGDDLDGLANTLSGYESEYE